MINPIETKLFYYFDDSIVKPKDNALVFQIIALVFQFFFRIIFFVFDFRFLGTAIFIFIFNMLTDSLKKINFIDLT